MAAAHTIILRGDNFTRREDNSNEAITPGMLLEFNANDKLQKHSTSGGDAAALFALEDDAIGGEVGTAYASGDRISYADVQRCGISDYQDFHKFRSCTG